MDLENNIFRLTPEEIELSGFEKEFPLTDAPDKSAALYEQASRVRQDAQMLSSSPLNADKGLASELNSLSQRMNVLRAEINRGIAVANGLKAIEDFLADQNDL